MTPPAIGVLALQGDVREHVGALAAAGAHPSLVRRPEDLGSLDGIVLPGGESTAMGRLLTTFGLLEPLRAAVAGGLPAFGSCAGLILLADRILDGRPDQPQVGGLDLVARRNAFGRQVDSFETDLAVPELGAPALHAVFIRAPWIEEVGAGVEVLARVADTDPHAGGRAVMVRSGSLLATAFHPELTGDRRVHRLFVRMVADHQRVGRR